jgi:tRNA G18 (ribose-2'-O)-methylase SpoU
MDYMQSKIDDQITGAISENQQLQIELDQVNIRLARHIDLAHELRSWFNSDLLDKNTDLYLLLEQVEAAANVGAK